MSSLVFCNIAWAKYYNGVETRDLYSGATWKGSDDPAEYAELWNFSVHDDNFYGYVATAPHWHINLESLGGTKADDHIDGVSVIWIAPHPRMKKRVVVGWYKNARVYKKYTNRPGDLPKEYIMEAQCKDCVLLPEEDRSFIIPNPFRTIWFAKRETELIDSVRGYIQHYQS